MRALKNILVATDFSETSAVAIEFARELCRAFGSKLHVVHVVGNVVAGAIGVEGYTTNFAALQHEVEEAAHKQLDAIITEEDRRALAARAVVLTSSSPAQSIVAYAKDVQIDLVVVGADGRGGVPHSPMGSVAEQIVRLARCPVLTVRPPARELTAPKVTEAAVHA